MSKFIFSNKLKIFFSILLVAGSISVALRSKNEKAIEKVQSEKMPIEVSVKKVGDLKNSSNNFRYSGMVVGDQEIKIVASASGVVNSVNFDLGNFVTAGKIMLSIDDQGGLLGVGDNNFKSAQVQQLELALSEAKKAYNLAKDKYESDDTDANKIAKDIAKIQYESAKIGLDNSLNARIVTTPISGTVTSRLVVNGDSVSAGQLLATVSKTNVAKIQFFLSGEDVSKISLGSEINVTQNGNEMKAKISNISPQADASTRKFLVQAYPAKGSKLLLGTIVDVSLKSNDNSTDAIFLPLSAISNTQTENFLFIAQNGLAKKIPVTLQNISGETALIKADVSNDDLIIIEGNKLLQDGDKIQIK